MLMYHKQTKQPVDCHPSKVESMKAKGWNPKPPTTTTKAVKPAEEKANG